MYTNDMLESIKKVEANREANAALEPRRMTAEEKDALLRAYHPDYKEGEEFVHLAVGPNKGDKVPKELGALLQGKSRISPEEIDLTNPDYDVDVLIIGGTSLAVYPAAGLIDYYRGNKLVLVNKSATPMDARADLLVQGSIGEIFSKIEV